MARLDRAISSNTAVESQGLRRLVLNNLKSAWIDSVRGGRCVAGIAAQNEIGCKTAGGGRGLDAITSLPDTPEKSFPRSVPPECEAAVRRERAQPGPLVLDATD